MRAMTSFRTAAAIAVLMAVAAPATALASVLPDPALTSGAVRTTNPAEVCGDRHTRQFRHWSRAQADRILLEYGLPAGPYGQSYEIDHLVPLALGGSDEDANLWPESRRSIEPVWNAERKDHLECKLADLVCSGRLNLTTAQEAIRKDWIAAYKAYIGEQQ